MSYLHSHGIINRDSKLSNVFIDKYNLPKFGGFDISKDDELDIEYTIKSKYFIIRLFFGHIEEW